MGQVINPFNIPIIQDVISEKSYSLIKKEVKEYLNKNQQYFTSPWNCPTKTSLPLPPNQSFKSKIVESEIKNLTEKYIKEWGFLEELNLSLYGLWINISKKNSFQEYHTHINRNEKHIFSGTLYIDVYEDSGNLVLVNPLNNIISHYPLSSKIFSEYFITPQNGLIVSFPSFIGHYVGENKNNNDRISISWNITLH